MPASRCCTHASRRGASCGCSVPRTSCAPNDWNGPAPSSPPRAPTSWKNASTGSRRPTTGASARSSSSTTTSMPLPTSRPEEPRHHGLTPFGAQVIREMNRLGMTVDLAHATEQVTRDVVDITAKPIILSHTALRRTPRKYTRYIYADHARLIAATDGVIGVWPAGRGGLERWDPAFQEAGRTRRPRAPRHGHGHGRPAQTPSSTDYGALPDIAEPGVSRNSSGE